MKNHTKMQLIASRYETTPTKSHQDEEKSYQVSVNRTKHTKSHQENLNQDKEKKSYQDSRNHNKMMTSSIMWPHIGIRTPKVIGIDSKIEVTVLSPTTWEAHHTLWWASQVVGDTTITSIEVSISILSWCLKAYWIYADSGVYKQKIAHQTASNQPLWKAWPQPIVTAASLVTSWLPLWCHSDARVTKSWQYAPLKN